jgi:hypothetical protein
MMIRVCLFLLLGVGTAVSQIAAPAAGFVRDRAGCLRPVFGASGSFVLSEILEEGVLSAGFGKTAGFAKTADTLLVIRSGEVAERLPAPTGPAVFYPDASGEMARIYFPVTRDLWRARGSGWEKFAEEQQPDNVLPEPVRLAFAETVVDWEWLSDEWIIVRQPTVLHAVRVVGERLVVQLPEPLQ